TRGRRLLDDIPILPHRAITAVEVVNEAATPLKLDRFSLPVVHLSLFEGNPRTLWTEQVRVVHTQKALSHGDPATVTLDEGPPPQAGPQTRLVHGPRDDTKRTLAHAFFTQLWR
ncbi:MAG: hypothetical protein AAFX99_29595, partial [Myxococcota bacterium]